MYVEQQPAKWVAKVEQRHKSTLRPNSGCCLACTQEGGRWCRKCQDTSSVDTHGTIYNKTDPYFVILWASLVFERRF